MSSWIEMSANTSRKPENAAYPGKDRKASADTHFVFMQFDEPRQCAQHCDNQRSGSAPIL